MATYENKLKMQYLMRYLDSKRRAKAILDEIRNLEDLATKVTVTFNDMPGGGGADGGRVRRGQRVPHGRRDNVRRTDYDPFADPERG